MRCFKSKSNTNFI